MERMVVILLAVLLAAGCRTTGNEFVIRDLADTYEFDIKHFAEKLAKLHIESGHAMYLLQGGPEQLDPAPISGFPVCQLGCCIMRVQTEAGPVVDVESTFTEAYNAVLDRYARKAMQNKTKEAIARPESGQAQPHR